MTTEYVRMSEFDRINSLKDDAIRRTEEKKKAEQLRQQENAKKDEELARLKAELAVQKQLSEKDSEIARLRSELENAQKTTVTTNKLEEVERNPSAVDYETLKKTIYGHAKMEGMECQKAVAFVLLNRARANQPYWGGSSITEVCRKPGQFWPWNDKNDVHIDDWTKYNSIDAWLPGVLNGQIPDNTNGSDHLLPNWEHQDWLSNVDLKATHGNFNFYRAKWL